MSKKLVEYYTVVVTKHTIINTGDIRQGLHGDKKLSEVLYKRQFMDDNLSELLRVAETLRKPVEATELGGDDHE